MLSVASLTKAFETRGEKPVAAVNGVSFEVAPGEFFSIVGPSGCGKTTILRSIAGLEEPDYGEIRIGGHVVFSSAGRINVPPQRRGISLMFQSQAIWPHLSVYENVAFPLRARGAGNVDAEVVAMLETVALSSMAGRPASRLSGGQQQRLSLARALVSRPDVLLLDEPLSSLDVKLRRQLRSELKRVQQQHGVTTVYVTHDQDEALSLSDRIAVMSGGRLLQVGPARQVYERPENLEVAEFIGQINLLKATIVAAADGVARFATPLGVLTVEGAAPAAAGQSWVLSFRPESAVVAQAEGGPNRLVGKVATVIYYGDHQDIEVRCDGATILARAPAGSGLRAGDPVQVVLDPRDILAFPAA
jgi:iron(III) transport system ATP-binding protein